jgi:endo-1,4-beta-xylanase
MNWTNLDTAYQFARDQGIPFKLHTLIWGQQQPGWIDALSNAQKLEEIEEWFSALAARYPDIEMIDVVNEPINAPPSYADALGGDGATGWDWVITAFELAREHFPGAILILNEYRVLQGPEFTQQYLELVDLLQDRGLIDAIGEEGHFLEKTSASMVQTNLDTLAATGLPIYITEFDLNIADDAQHANVMRDLFTVFWEHSAVQGVTHWGYREDSMWRPDAYLLRSNGTERPGLEWLVCYLGGGNDCDVHVPVYTPSGWQGDAAGLTLQAELFDEGSGVLALGEVVAYTNAGEWIKFSAVEFQNGWNKLAVHYAKGNDTELANVSIHLGSLGNPAAAVVDLPYTGGWGMFDTVEVDWTSLSTTEDVYISFNGDPDAVANLDYVHFFEEAPAGGGGNLLSNGSFETGITGWSSWNGSTLSASTAQAFEGSQSLHATDRTATNQFAVSPNIGGALIAGNIYSVSARVYQTGAGADTVRLASKVGCSSGDSFPWIHNHTSVPANTWTLLSGPLVIPESCVITEVLIFFEGTTIGVDVYVDDVRVSERGPNLMSNGGFETGITGWGSWNGSTLSSSTAQAYEGSQSLYATDRTATNQFAVSPNVGGSMTAGTAYLASAWVYHTGAGADTVRLASKVGCSSGDSFPWIHNNTSVPVNTWTLLVGRLEIPASCVITEVLIFFEGTTIGVDVYVDDVQVTSP